MRSATEFITIIRPSFMKFCDDACRAAAFNHLLFRIAGKCKDQPKEKVQSGEITWYAKTEQITDEMAKAWGVCKVRKEVNMLIDMGLIGRSSDPQWGANRTKHFSFGREQCQKFLEYCEQCNICVVHLDIPDEVKHLIYISNANDKNIICICANHQMQMMNLSNANDESIRAITIDSLHKNHNKEDNKDDSCDASATASSSPASSTLSVFEEVYHSLPIPVTYNDAVIYLKPHGAHDELDAVQVLELARKLWKEAHEEDDGRDDTGKRTTDTDSSQQHTPVVTVPGMDAGVEHQSNRAGDTEKPTTQGKRTRTPKEVKSKQPALLSEPKEVQERIDAQRGYKLEEKVDIIRERDAIKQWCALHPLEDFEIVIDELVNRDKYWSKPENRGRIGGLTLLRETPKVLARLRMTITETPEERETITIEGEEMSIAEAKRRGLYSDFDIYVGNGYEERKRFIEEGERLLALGLLPTDEELGWVPVGATGGVS